MEAWGGEGLQLFLNLLDVLLVSYVIYKILLLVKGTRAQPMLLGLGIVIMVYLAAKSFSLVTLSWMLGNLLGSVLLLVIVLFQDDLRRAFTKVGLIGGFGFESVDSLERSIAELSQAAFELAGRRIGALVVIQRDIGLEEYTEHAVPIEALVSRQILVSIFLPNSPIHDGAVVVDGGRIAAAGAVLPLTFNPKLDPALGTRHRAAIGLSERTDAVVVVVSEERGEVSLVREGHITADLDQQSLYNALMRLCVRRRGSSSPVKAAKDSVESPKEEPIAGDVVEVLE